MKWSNKEIKDLNDDELWEAIHSVAFIDANRIDKLSEPRKRHKNIFENHPPVENPIFTNLANALNQEYRKRNNVKV